ncbi:hypothetical protein Clacol_002942 [Clathrus columnatus]|uniref:BRCT domain-containing protein n=1 Tax=Clathrus columnatus TaxID=1419009 RepID=A0AAV5A676_9AGAM|nr:hypothetical protein Clacol_002942 [Clathrus columnatus]
MKDSKRRGAKKVPNVILRPPPPLSKSREPASTSRAEGGDDDHSGELDFRAESLPLRGSTLFAHAQALGAIRSDDFTDRVTHLVADAPGSAKYKCAVERNVPILKDSWVNDIYDAWLSGETIEVEKFIAKHRLPIFTGVQLCITGMRDAESRERVAEIIEKQGGTHLRSLNAPVTHLLCSIPTSEKISRAKEINGKKGMGTIRIIWEEWFWDCLEFHGRWGEQAYDIDRPRPARKLMAETVKESNKQVTESSSATLSQPKALPKSFPTSFLLEDDPPRLAQTQKQKGIGLRILRDIVHTRKKSSEKEGDETQAPCDSTRILSVNTQTLPETNAAMPSPQKEITSALDRLSDYRNNTSFAVASTSSAISRPFTRNTHGTVLPQKSISTFPIPEISSIPNIFAGYSFRALGEAKEGAMLCDAIRRRGGRWLDDGDSFIEPDFFLVRLVGGYTFWHTANAADRAKFRTECWVERSILEERMCAAEGHIVFTPLKIITPVEGSERLSVSLSGLDSAETFWTKRLLRAIGANVLSVFSKSSSHLICPSGHGEKFAKAREWKIPVVDLEWLFFIAKNGRIPHCRDFEVANGGNPQSLANHSKNIVQIPDPKGKRKATESEDIKIIDITNANVLADVTDSTGYSQDVQNFKRPGSLHVPMRETVSAVNCPAYDVFVPESTIGEGTLSPIKTPTGISLSFGEPIGLQVSGCPESIVNDSTSGYSPQSPYRPLPRDERMVEQDLDKKQTQIPSSCSPSPLRMVTGPMSVASPPISDKRGLRTAITALLGKRGPEPATFNELSIQSRPTKRPRSQLSLISGPGRPVPSLVSLTTASTSQLSEMFLSPKEEDSPNEEESNGLRVIYEDPDQRDERNRLISLFEKSAAHVNDNETTPDQASVEGVPETSKRKSVRRRANRSNETNK